MADLVFELFSEEIPAGMQATASTHLYAQVHGGLSDLGVTNDGIHAYVTPRRLAIVVKGLPERTQDVTTERKGPRVGAPDAALEGFLKSTGLRKDQLEERDGVYFATVHTPGKPLAEALVAVLEKAAASIPWPKSMRWGAYDMRWVRPLRAILCLLDGAVVPVSVGHLTAGRVTYGHRFLAPQAIELAHAKDYVPALEKAFVVPDADVRKRKIHERALALTASHGLTLKEDAGLLAEVAGLVEYPVVMMGRFEDRYLALPIEVPSTVMKSHQKYFTVLDADGGLAPQFVFVANMQAKDGGTKIIAGNERVVRARLADGEFYWQQDVATPLADLLPKLSDMVFHAKLGSVAQKVERLKILAQHIAKLMGADPDLCGRAAELCKADLVSGMVGEFPELQGVMGRYYALQQGEDKDVADAIRDHYRPLGPSDVCPTAPVSVAVALADKLDTLAGMFAVGEKPTGSKDPFALRRAALGVIRLIIENNLRIFLSSMLSVALNSHGQKEIDNVSSEVLGFIVERLKIAMKEEGIGHDRITAVFGTGKVSLVQENYPDDLILLIMSARALEAFLATPDGANLLAAYKRARNIVAKSNVSMDVLMSAAPGAGTQDEERGLHTVLGRLQDGVKPLLVAENYDGAMARLASVRAEVDAFFDKVTVMHDDDAVKMNRLRLLAHLCATFESLADFARIEG